MKILNSPIFITILLIIVAFVLKSQIKTGMASEIRGAYDEIISIAEDATSDAQKTKAIQDFAEQIGTQVKSGFSIGFSSMDSNIKNGEIKDKDAVFLEAKKKIQVTDVKEVQSEWSGRQSTIFKIKNNSEYQIKKIRVNLEFFRNGELIDVKNEYLHDVKILDIGENLSVKVDRRIPNKLSDAEKEKFTFDAVEVTVLSFAIKE